MIMKKIISRIAIVLAGMFLALNANAQSNENPRRIWLVAHACNAHRWLQTAVQDGANGVEIDVNCADKISPTATSVDISVNHKAKYYSPKDREAINRGIKNRIDHWVSLQEYLNFEEMDKISILWLDLKPEKPGQVFHIVKEVHRILEDRYGSREAVPFSIIYGVYRMNTLKNPIGLDYSLSHSGMPLIDWLRDNLWENEGTGFACEGRHGPYWTRETLEELKNFFNGHNFPKGKHFACQGTGLPFRMFFNKRMINTLVQLKNWRDDGSYCVRTGAWTMGKEEYGLQMISSKKDYPKSYGTECDLVLMDGRSDFFPAKSLAPGYDCLAVQKFVRRFFHPASADSYYSKYNRGHYVLAGNRWEDPFYK